MDGWHSEKNGERPVIILQHMLFLGGFYLMIEKIYLILFYLSGSQGSWFNDIANPTLAFIEKTSVVLICIGIYYLHALLSSGNFHSYVIQVG